MFRLYDMRTGLPGPVGPGRPGQLRTYLATPAGPGTAGAGALRAALIADLIRRVAEQHHLLVRAWQAADSAGFTAACGDLNIHPAQHAPRPPDGLDVGIAGPRAGAGQPRDPGPPEADAGQREADPGPPGAGAHWIRPAEVLADGVTPAELAARGLDPLALRLALLQHHHSEPAVLDWDTLTSADQALRGWRRQVARWALSPSKPMCAPYVTDVTGAFDNDLGTPAAIAVLGALALDDQIPPGSRFEAFAYLDHLFGLDLARDVGR